MKCYIIFVCLGLVWADIGKRQALPFKQVGVVYVSQATVRVKLNYDLRGFGNTCDKLLSLDRRGFAGGPPTSAVLSSAFEALNPVEEPKYNPDPRPTVSVDSVWQGLEEACAQVRSWPTEYGLYAKSTHDRTERGPIVLGALMGYGLAMTASLVLSELGLGDDDSGLAELVEEQGVMLARLVARVEHLGQWRAQTELRLTLLEVQRSISEVTRGLSTLVTGQRISTSLLPANPLRRLWTKIETLVETLGGEVQLPFSQATALYEFPATFVLEDGGLVAEIFVPLVTEKMRLFWREDFPLSLHAEEAAVTIRRRRHEEYFAVDERHTLFVTMSSAELDRCHQQQRRYFCAAAALRKDFDESCEAALYMGESRGVARHCQTETFKRSWSVWRAAGRLFHVYAQRELRTKILCANGTQRLDVLAPGFHDVRLSASCAMSSDLFYLPREVEYELEEFVSAPLLPSLEGLQAATDEQESIAALRRDIDKMNQAARRDGDTNTWVWVVVGLSLALTAIMSSMCMYLGFLYRRAQQL